MDWIREFVSGKKNRYKENGFNLDLTYVTPRVVAMSFPASGFESTYRNGIDDVVKLIKDRHSKNYLVFNLSGRKYNYAKFDNQVLDYPWEDHHSPPLHFLFQICSDIHNCLNNKDSSVVIVHCLAGKGRTGTVICCYLMYTGIFTKADDALLYYRKKRFLKAGGVTQPSQIRYVHYFEKLFYGERIPTKGLFLDQVVISGIPKFSAEGALRPSFKVFQVKKTKISQDDIPLFPVPNVHVDPSSFIAVNQEKQEIVFAPPEKFFLNGDILIRAYNKGRFKQEAMFRFAFNTAFIEEKDGVLQPLSFLVNDVDPDKTAKDPRFPKSFKVEVSFKKWDLLGPAADPALVAIVKEEQTYMDIIDSIVKEYKKPDYIKARVILFGDPDKDDIQDILSEKDDKTDKIELADEFSSDEEEEEEEKSMELQSPTKKGSVRHISPDKNNLAEIPEIKEQNRSQSQR